MPTAVQRQAQQVNNVKEAHLYAAVVSASHARMIRTAAVPPFASVTHALNARAAMIAVEVPFVSIIDALSALAGRIAVEIRQNATATTFA